MTSSTVTLSTSSLHFFPHGRSSMEARSAVALKILLGDRISPSCRSVRRCDVLSVLGCGTMGIVQSMPQRSLKKSNMTSGASCLTSCPARTHKIQAASLFSGPDRRKVARSSARPWFPRCDCCSLVDSVSCDQMCCTIRPSNKASTFEGETKTFSVVCRAKIGKPREGTVLRLLLRNAPCTSAIRPLSVIGFATAV